MSVPDRRPVRVLGAGVSGLAAAIVLARAGRAVEVFERRGDSGARFGGDFQGIESWTSPRDALDEVAEWGVDPGTFRARPFRAIAMAGEDGRAGTLETRRTAFYLVERGTHPGSLDQGLKLQARREGVDLRYGVRVPEASCDVIATGPRRATGVVVGELSRSPGEDRVVVLFSHRSAPGGYAYFIRSGGVALIASVLMRRVAQPAASLQGAIAWFTTRVPELDARQPLRRVCGIGCFAIPRRYQSEGRLYVGEAAGLQDALWGFGIRSALTSGALAARSLLDKTSYERAVRQRLRPLQVRSFLNRCAYDALGRLAPWCLPRLWHASQRRTGDGLGFLARLYRPFPLGRAFGAAIARWRLEWLGPSADGGIELRYLPIGS